MSTPEDFMLEIARWTARGFELAGIAAIVTGTLIALTLFVKRSLGIGRPPELAGERDIIAAFRRSLGRSILIGLELLVAADIILTVAVRPTWDSVLVLGAIVLIRTFLSVSLEIEIEGRLPWRKADAKE
ncbi:DUF1622 domain-containing protein [Altererythrobacter sp. KTW20L]|uniref:DUF1622 domain-containing protein n=1 Tax=Altererythrobacter sp. KTW20L TaxID=2942210 RepID=UPI0020BF775E|nr:DUF1622 domain-containing protein [Altererythrobacter sp. KTW20L]MCL6249584.1 DUF1622 domain-containing protein [Altererythrobacter sp. KTW20L]